MSPQARPKGEFPFGGTALGAKSVLIRQCRDTPSYPYPGIRPFREDEEFLFFGREAQVDAMVDTLARQRFLTVIGSSGCGKSSLVNCGLRPALHRGLLTRAGSAWRMATCRPGGHPLRALAEALARSGTLLRDQPAGPFSQAELIEATLAMSRLGLVEAYRQAGLPQGTNLLVVVDQFEELFRYRALADADAEDGDPATAFVNLLLEARAHDAPIHIVLTMRSDFLGDCARFGGLPEAINSSQYLVPRMSRDERRAAILGPARVFDAGIAPTLLTRLVNDVGDDPDQLSLLQHALARTWAHWQAAGDASPIDAIHYDAIGTLAHALNQHAEETFAALPADRQRLSAAAFGALTDKRGRGVRRPTRFSDLCLITGSAADELAATLAPFRATGAAFLMPPEGDELEPDTIVDLAHESLMRLWNRLRGWGEREADAARMLHRLSDAAELHASGQASLWRDPELQFALDWRDRTHPTAVWARRYGRDLAPALAFLEASRAARDETRAAEIARAEAARRAESERRRNRQVLHLTLVTVVVAVLVAIGTVMLWQRAERAGEVAVSRQYAAQSATELAGGTLDRALLLAAAAFHRQPSFEARDSLLAALAQAPQDWQVAGQQGVSALAHSPDGRLVASGGNDGSVKLWDWGSGEPIATLSGHREGVLALAFSPDGRRLASGSIDHTVVLWDLASRRSVATLADHEGPVLALAFGADNILASAGADRRIVLRDGLTGAPRGPALDGHRETVSGLAFSPDGRTLASVDYSGTLFLWAPGQATTPRLRASHPAILRGVAFSPDGAILATASADGHVLLWHTHNLALKDQPLSGHDRPVRNLAFSPDGRYLVSVGEDRQVLAHDLARPGAAVPGRIGHRSEVVAVVFGYDGQFFTGGTDDLLIRHDAARHGPFAVRLPELDGTVWAMAFSPDGRNLATAGQDARIRLRDARSGVPQGPEWSGHEALVTSLAFSPDGLLLASAGQDGRLLLWNTADSSALPRELQRGGVPLRRAVFSPDGRSLAAAGRDGQIRLWALPDGTPLSVAPKHGGPVADLAWSPDGKLLASAGFDGHIRLWNAEDGQSAGQLARPDAGILYRVAWAADGQHIAIASQKQGLLLWHRQSEQALSSGKDASILLDLAFSPDGHVLATADKDGTVQLWDVATYQSLREPLLRQAGPVLALAWAPDGSRLASAGWDRGVVLSRTSPDDWAGLACDLVRHNPPAEGSVGCAQR